MLSNANVAVCVVSVRVIRNRINGFGCPVQVSRSDVFAEGRLGNGKQSMRIKNILGADAASFQSASLGELRSKTVRRWNEIAETVPLARGQYFVTQQDRWERSAHSQGHYENAFKRHHRAR